MMKKNEFKDFRDYFLKSSPTRLVEYKEKIVVISGMLKMRNIQL